MTHDYSTHTITLTIKSMYRVTSELKWAAHRFSWRTQRKLSHSSAPTICLSFFLFPRFYYLCCRMPTITLTGRHWLPCSLQPVSKCSRNVPRIPQHLKMSSLCSFFNVILCFVAMELLTAGVDKADNGFKCSLSLNGTICQCRII